MLGPVRLELQFGAFQREHSCQRHNKWKIITTTQKYRVMFNSHFRYLIESSSKERLKKKKSYTPCLQQLVLKAPRQERVPRLG